MHENARWLFVTSVCKLLYRLYFGQKTLNHTLHDKEVYGLWTIYTVKSSDLCISQSLLAHMYTSLGSLGGLLKATNGTCLSTHVQTSKSVTF